MSHHSCWREANLLLTGTSNSDSDIRIVIGTAENASQDVIDVMAFRKRILVDSLGWDLTVTEGLEQDEFDRADTVHCAVWHKDTLVGSFRAIRADRTYLAAEKFHHLATLKSYPDDENSWEISRFVVAMGKRRFSDALTTYASMFRFAFAMNADRLVAFSDLSHERLLSRIGIVTERYGPPFEIGIDAVGRPVKVVSGEISIAAQSGSRFLQLLSHVNPLEESDVYSLPRRRSLSA